MVEAILWMLLALDLYARIRSFRFLKPVDGPLPPDLPAIDVVVPARNEEAVFKSSMGSILGQEYPSLRVIVVDDQSTDGTLVIMDQMAAQDARMAVVRGVDRPTGWVGKTWAVHQGYLKTDADWIGFIDADMSLHPRALATAIEVARRESADLVSLLPGVECRTFWQGAIAASFLQFLAHLYPISRVNDPKSSTAIAAGGFILIRRSAYLQAGGHEAGRHDIVEDIQLARRVKAQGHRIYVRLAPDLAQTHMYGSFRQIWLGLRKNAYAGMDYKLHKFVFGIAGSLFLAWAPLIAVSRSEPLIGLWIWLAQAAATFPITVFLRISPLFAFTVPAGISAYAAITVSSVWHYYQGRILWKDRALAVDEVQSGIAAERSRRS